MCTSWTTLFHSDPEISDSNSLYVQVFATLRNIVPISFLRTPLCTTSSIDTPREDTMLRSPFLARRPSQISIGALPPASSPASNTPGAGFAILADRSRWPSTPSKLPWNIVFGTARMLSLWEAPLYFGHEALHRPARWPSVSKFQALIVLGFHSSPIQRLTLQDRLLNKLIYSRLSPARRY